METDKKLDTIEEELKLMKGELKQTLSSVRDYLLNMELPSTEFSTILAALGDSEQNVTMKGTFSLPPDSGAVDEAEDESSKHESDSASSEEESASSHDKAATEPESALNEELGGADGDAGTESELSTEDESASQDDNLEPETGLPPPENTDENFEQDESLVAEPQLSAEEELIEKIENEKISNELSKSIPKVNLLANLISWIAKAKNEIGYDQLPTFLEVYGISGHLSPELKEVIMSLAEITSEQPEEANKAEIWSQTMLSLHGVLTGGDAPLYPMNPSWNEEPSEMSDVEPAEEEIIEVDKPVETPVKLKLVFPNGDGKSKEYCIDLAPEADGNDS